MLKNISSQSLDLLFPTSSVAKKNLSQASLNIKKNSHLGLCYNKPLNLNLYQPGVLKLIYLGDSESTIEVFFTNKANNQTELIQNIVNDLLFNPEKVSFQYADDTSDYNLFYNGQSYPLYELLLKVKWDLIELTENQLNQYSKIKKISSSIMEDFYGQNYYYESKKHLYEKLHISEKYAITAYTASSDVNDFLRGDGLELLENSFEENLLDTAVLCSGLNKIPSLKKAGYSDLLYRCLTNSKAVDYPGTLVDLYVHSTDSHEKVKERGFLSLSMTKPCETFYDLDSFTEGEEEILNIYSNAFNLAKDISGLSMYPSEQECLCLPNSKEMPIKRAFLSNAEGVKMRHLFFTKLISKRQKVI